jgi:hypothetical protein
MGDELSMSVTVGAWFAGIAGGMTGAFDVSLRRTRSSVLVGVVCGVGIAVAAYAAFVIMGMAVSVLSFNSTESNAWPALLSVLIGCVAFLVVRAIHSAVASHFGMPERRAPSTRPTLEEFIGAQDPTATAMLGRLKAAPTPARLKTAPTSVGRAPSERRTVGDLIEAQPRGGAPTMWLGGVGLAVLPVIYGISCIVTRRGELGTVIWPSEVQGAPAIALGVGWIGVGLFLHFHFFFGLHSRLAVFSRRAKALALVVAGAGLAIAGTWSVFAKIPQ